MLHLPLGGQDKCLIALSISDAATWYAFHKCLLANEVNNERIYFQSSSPYFTICNRRFRSPLVLSFTHQMCNGITYLQGVEVRAWGFVSGLVLFSLHFWV